MAFPRTFIFSVTITRVDNANLGIFNESYHFNILKCAFLVRPRTTRSCFATSKCQFNHFKCLHLTYHNDWQEKRADNWKHVRIYGKIQLFFCRIAVIFYRTKTWFIKTKSWLLKTKSWLLKIKSWSCKLRAHLCNLCARTGNKDRPKANFCWLSRNKGNNYHAKQGLDNELRME